MFGTSTAEASQGPSDPAILNFALNLEYLAAEFYLHAAIGHGLSDNEAVGTGKACGATGDHQVPFTTKLVRQYADEIAADERPRGLPARRWVGPELPKLTRRAG